MEILKFFIVNKVLQVSSHTLTIEHKKNWQNAKKEKLRTNNRERVSKWVGKGKEERRRQNLVLCLLLQKFSLSLPVSFESTTPWSSRAEHNIPCRKNNSLLFIWWLQINARQLQRQHLPDRFISIVKAICYIYITV